MFISVNVSKMTRLQRINYLALTLRHGVGGLPLFWVVWLAVSEPWTNVSILLFFLALGFWVGFRGSIGYFRWLAEKIVEVSDRLE